MTILVPLWTFSMVKINLLVTNNCVGSSVLGVMDFLDFCNSLWKLMHPDSGDKAFEYQLYSPNGSHVVCSNNVLLATTDIKDYVPADGIFLTSFYAYDAPAMEQFIGEIAPFNDILQEAAITDQVIATYCTGSFGLAASGILDGKSATTSWWLKNLFQNRFPKVQLAMEELVIEADNILTGGATTSYFNVCLKMVERLTNPVFATQVSKMMLLDRHRLSQQPFIDSAFIISKHDSLVEDIQHWMMEHYQENVTLDQLCEQFNVTKRTLNRRFKASCGETPLNYLQKIRVERAKHLLETTDLAVERIVEMVGYEDPASFRKLFSNETQLTPKAYRQRFSMALEHCC